MQRNGDDLELQISASMVKAEKAIDSLVAKLDVLQTSLTGVSSGGMSKNMSATSSAMAKTSKQAFSLARAFGKLYANYFLIIRGSKALWKSIKSTTDYIEAFNYFEVSFGKIASEWSQDFERFGYENAEAYAESFTQRMTESLGDLSGLTVDKGNGLLTTTGTKNLALNIQEITQAASQLASITNSIGLVGEISLTTADSFTKLAADMSSLFNIDFSSAMKNLQSGLIGQSRALYKYGIDITNATLQTYAYELGLSKAVSEMTQSEKMQLRMLAILDQSKVSWGDLANTINSPSNMIRQFTNNLKETGMVLGQLFIPLLQKVLPIINGVTIAIKELLVNLAGFLGIQLDFSSFGKGYSDLGEDAYDLADGLDDATAAAKKLKTATLGIDELNINSPQSNAGAGGFGGGIDLTSQILAATEEYKRVWDEAFSKMENKAQDVADKIKEFFANIVDSIKNIASAISELVTPAFEYLFNTFVKPLSEVLLNLWKKIIVPLAEVFVNVFSPIIETVGYYLGLLWENIIKPLGQFVWEVLVTAFQGMAEVLNNLVIPAISYVIVGFNFFLENVIRPLVDFFKSIARPVVESVFNTIGNLIKSLQQIMVGLIKFITGVFSLNWQKAWEGIRDVFKGIMNGVLDIFEGIINFIIAGLQSFLNGFVGTISAVGGLIGIDINVPQLTPVSLPRYQTGGFPEDGLFMANHGELVGQFSNGRTAVANNEQIVTGIKEGVREAVSEILAPYLADIAQNTRETADKEWSIGDREIARANARGQRSMGFALITE